MSVEQSKSKRIMDLLEPRQPQARAGVRAGRDPQPDRFAKAVAAVAVEKFQLRRAFIRKRRSGRIGEPARPHRDVVARGIGREPDPISVVVAALDGEDPERLVEDGLRIPGEDHGGGGFEIGILIDEIGVGPGAGGTV